MLKVGNAAHQTRSQGVNILATTTAAPQADHVTSHTPSIWSKLKSAQGAMEVMSRTQFGPFQL